MTRELIAVIRRDHLERLAADQLRPDQRGMTDRRKCLIEVGTIGTAAGSCRVHLGETDVLAGLKLDRTAPNPDQPNQGILVLNADLSPIAAPEFERTPLRDTSVELARVIDRGLRASGALDLDALCIERGREVVSVYIDILVLDFHGNLYDAVAVAALGALLDAQQQSPHADAPSITVHHYPIASTLAKIGSELVLDPEVDEEAVAQARLTVITDERDTLVALQKGQAGALTHAEVMAAVSTAIDANRSLREHLLAHVDG